jgi:hypothetical protein
MHLRPCQDVLEGRAICADSLQKPCWLPWSARQIADACREDDEFLCPICVAGTCGPMSSVSSGPCILIPAFPELLMNHRHARRALALSLALPSLAFPSLSHATNGYFSHGVGVRSQGVAGTGIALPQDGLAAAANPAGTALVGHRLDIGMSWFKPSRSARISATAQHRTSASMVMAGSTSSFPNSDTCARSATIWRSAWRCMAMAA